MKRLIIGILLFGNIIFGADYTSKLLGDINGNLIIKENIYEIHPFASLTKVMTAVLVVEEIEKGKIDYNDIITVPKDALKNKGSSVFLKQGQKVKLIDLLYATLVHSANDAAYTLAYYVSKGNIDKFVEAMNKKAKSIGMTDTVFCTPNGLPTSMTGKGMDRGTAYDMYKLSMVALKKSKIVEVAGTKKIAILDKKMTITNRNQLIGKDGVYGLKTGFHDLSKYNISVAFKKDKENYVIILFGGNTLSSRDSEIKKTIEEFVPPILMDNVTYINESVNLYKNNNTTNTPAEEKLNKQIEILYKTDEISIIKNIINDRKELNNSSFDSPIIIEK